MKLEDIDFKDPFLIVLLIMFISFILILVDEFSM
jgi:hypothetical protein